MTNNISSAKIASEMQDDFDQKCLELKKIFAPLSLEERYRTLMSMGQALLPPPELSEADLVRGCQSKLYLHSASREGKIFFTAKSDALISAGLAALLIFLYSGETPETILKRPPSIIGELNIGASLSPSRSNGLAHIHLRMQKDALMKLRSS
jgi:cysteine desulfuration protein SufE